MNPKKNTKYPKQRKGKLKTLKRFKEDVKSVKEGFECGIAFENYEDVKVNDVLEVFELVEEKKEL